MTGNGWRISGASGILFLVAFIVGVAFQGDVADYKDSGDKIVAWYEDNADQFLIGDFITGLAFILFYFPFLAGLYARLRQVDAEPPIFARTALAGGLLLPVAGLAGGIFQTGLALLKGDASPEVAQFASAAAFHSFAAVEGLAAVLMGAASFVILTRGGMWKWLGWLGAVAAVLGVISTASSIDGDPDGPIASLGFLSSLLFAIWLVAASVTLWRLEGTTATAAPNPVG